VLWLVALLRGQVIRLWRHMADPQIRSRVMLGTLFGPTIGMICYVSALKFSPAGLVSTIASISPLVLLPIVYLRYKARIGWDVVAACALAIVGVAVIS
jgi:drug/metabolite transporter (DMT)-like permease